MTVESLRAAKDIVNEARDGEITGVFEYTHVITGKKLWSVEHWTNTGATLRSGYCLNVRQVYDSETKQWKE